VDTLSRDIEDDGGTDEEEMKSQKYPLYDGEEIKKSCGHNVGARCSCHPLADRPKRPRDVCERLTQPFGVRISGETEFVFDTGDDE